MTRTQPQIVNATWVMTQGVQALLSSEEENGLPGTTENRAANLRRAIAAYCDWTESNDPHREHDFGRMTLFGAQLLFKIDYYHPDHDTLAPVPGSVELCRRVLTIMLAEEY